MMRKIVSVLIFLLVISISVDIFSAEDKKIPLISLESTNLEYHFGSIETGKIAKKVVGIRNKLDQPLAIREARSICECIDVDVEPQILERGESLEVEITLDATGISQEIEEIVYILTDNMEYELIRFVISATIIDSK